MPRLNWLTIAGVFVLGYSAVHYLAGWINELTAAATVILVSIYGLGGVLGKALLPWGAWRHHQGHPHAARTFIASALLLVLAGLSATQLDGVATNVGRIGTTIVTDVASQLNHPAQPPASGTVTAGSR